MHFDSTIPAIVSIMAILIGLGLLLRPLGQPYVVIYLLAGIVLGPHVLGIINNTERISQIGDYGVILLLFFIGMEISPRTLLKNWKIVVVGTLLQIAITVSILWLLGEYIKLDPARSVLLGFVMSLSSTAVLLKYLQETKEMDTKVGKDVVGILLMQDIAVIPMLIIMGIVSPSPEIQSNGWLQSAGGILLLGLFFYLYLREKIDIPLPELIRQDHELQLFSAIGICFLFALFSSLFGLSAALGSFAAGMLVGATQESQWVRRHLDSFYILFLALFFVDIGLLIKIPFISGNWKEILILVGFVLFLKTIINAFVFRILGNSWRQGFYGGALLSQIGEFSFVLAAYGLSTSTFTQHGYDLVVAVIAVTLIVSPLWIATVRLLVGRE